MKLIAIAKKGTQDSERSIIAAQNEKLHLTSVSKFKGSVTSTLKIVTKKKKKSSLPRHK